MRRGTAYGLCCLYHDDRPRCRLKAECKPPTTTYLLVRPCALRRSPLASRAPSCWCLAVPSPPERWCLSRVRQSAAVGKAARPSCCRGRSARRHLLSLLSIATGLPIDRSARLARLARRPVAGWLSLALCHRGREPVCQHRMCLTVYCARLPPVTAVTAGEGVVAHRVEMMRRVHTMSGVVHSASARAPSCRHLLADGQIDVMLRVAQHLVL